MSDPIDADEAFGPPSADEAFPPPTQREQRARVHATLGGSPMQDFIFGDADLEGSAAHHFRGLFNTARETYKAFKEGFGAGPLVPSEEQIHGLSESATAYLKAHGIVKDYADGQKEVTDAADSTFLKPAATEKAIESFTRGFVSNPVYQAGVAGVRGVNAAFAAAQRGIYVAGQEYGFPKLAADIAAYPESTIGSPHPTGTPHPPGLPEHPPLSAAELERAKSLGVLDSEEAWKNGVAAPAEAAEAAPAAPAQAAAEPAPAPDIHAAARAVAPEAIKEFDDLTKRRDTFRRWADEGTGPPNLADHLAATEARLKELEPEVTGAYDKARGPVAEAQEALRTGDPHIDAVLSHPDVADAIANPKVNRRQDVPYTAGPDKTGNGLNIDKHFPESFTIDGKTFDPAQPFAVHEFTERHAMDKLIGGGMDEATAYKVAHWEVAEKAEGKWYEDNGIDQAKAEAAYQPYIDKIEHEKLAKGDGDVPKDLYRKPYPHDSVDAARRETAPVPKPTAEEIAKGRRILAGGEAETEAPKGPSIEDQRATIAHDVGAQLVRAGRPPEEAATAAQLIAARYIARAERMKGALGTPEELYRREGAEIRAMEIRRKVAGARNPPAMARALDNFQQRMAAGKEAAAARRNEGQSAPKFVSAAEQYRSMSKEDRADLEKAWTEAQTEAGVEEADSSLLTKDDLAFMASGEFFQRKRPPGPDLFAQREAEGQTNLPGTERITQGELAQRKADEALKPTVAQKPMDIGLFSDDAAQRELFQQKLDNLSTDELRTLYQKTITAYHGSPHDFDKFDIGKIGTGEGAQAYGHGLYFAENEGVAKGYRDALKWKGTNWDDPQYVAGFWLNNKGGDRDAAIAHLQGSIPHQTTESSKQAVRDAIGILQKGDAGSMSANPGRMYQVSIKADPEHFLDWDKPLSEQSPKVREVAKGFGRPPEDFRGEQLMLALSRMHGGSENAAAKIREAGIPGIKYLDQGSRGNTRWIARHPQGGVNDFADEASAKAFVKRNPEYSLEAPKQTSNYVVFDDKDIEITHKDGTPVTGKEKAEAIDSTQREFFQKALGSFLPPVEGRKPLIKLAKDANASTFIHESGHQFLEELMRDAAHEAAPEEVRADADTVKRWLGIESHDDLNTGWPGERGKAARRAHEKFARGFEQYLREGIAPSAALARVFAQFKQWLTQIYQTLRGLGEPINDDIRRVFDRMLTRPDEATIAEGRSGAETFADRHEAQAESTIPEAAHETAETIQAESDNVAARHLPPDLHDARLADTTEEAGRREPGGPELDRHGNEPEAPAGNGGTAAEPGKVEAGGGQAAAEGTATRPEPAAGPSVKTKPPASATERFDDPDKAGNIVIPNLNTSEDVAAVIRKTASENNNFQEVRGPIPDSEVLALAEAMGMDPAYLDTRKIGEAWTAPQIVALRHLLIKSAANVRDTMVKAAGGDPAALMEYAEAKARHVMIQKTVSSVTAEAGRALRAFQGRFTEGMAEANQIGAFLKNATGKTLFQLQQEAKFGASLETPQQLALFIDSSERKGFASAVIEYYVNALISGPVTHARYAAGNMAKMLVTPLFEIPAGTAVGKFRELTGAGPAADRVYLGEIAPALYGIMKGSREGLWKAWDALQTGVTPPLPTERISPHFMTPGGSIPGPVGTVLRTPGRAVAAIHTFFKMATYEMSIQRLAYRAAMNEGLEGEAFANRVADLTVRPTSTMMTQATRGALKELFMAPTDYNSVSGQLTRAFNNPSPAGIALKVIAPFMKIGMQITREAFVERTPIGVASKEVRQNLSFKGGEMGQGGGAAFDEQMAKQITGIALVGASVGLTLEGIMNGDGPEDPEKRAVWLLSHRPNSITIGDITIPYQGLGGLGMLMRFSANMTHTAHGWDEEEGGTLALHFMQGLTKSVLDENFMRGFKDLLDAVYHPQEYGPNYVKQFATNWLPFSVGMSQTARMVDPYQREAKTIFQAAQAKVPWLSEHLMPRRDMFGEPMPNSAAEATARYANDPVVRAMDDLQMGVGKLKRDIRGVELTDEQYDELAMKAGRMAKMRLDRLVMMPGFSRMAPEMRLELMHKAINQSRETARKILMMEYPEIVRAAVETKVGKKMGTVPVNEKPKQTVH